MVYIKTLTAKIVDIIIKWIQLTDVTVWKPEFMNDFLLPNVCWSHERAARSFVTNIHDQYFMAQRSYAHGVLTQCHRSFWSYPAGGLEGLTCEGRDPPLHSCLIFSSEVPMMIWSLIAICAAVQPSLLQRKLQWPASFSTLLQNAPKGSWFETSCMSVRNAWFLSVGFCVGW